MHFLVFPHLQFREKGNEDLTKNTYILKLFISRPGEGKHDGAGLLLHRQRSFAARSAGESAPLYPNLFLASKPKVSSGSSTKTMY